MGRGGCPPPSPIPFRHLPPLAPGLPAPGSPPAACRSGRLQASRPTTLEQPPRTPAPARGEPAPHRWPLCSPAAPAPDTRAPPCCCAALRMRHAPTARRRGQTLSRTPGCSTALRQGGSAAAHRCSAGAAGPRFGRALAAPRRRRARGRPRRFFTGRQHRARRRRSPESRGRYRRTAAWTWSAQLFNISKKGGSASSLGSLRQSSVTLAAEKGFLRVRWGPLHSGLCPPQWLIFPKHNV